MLLYLNSNLCAIAHLDVVNFKVNLYKAFLHCRTFNTVQQIAHNAIDSNFVAIYARLTLFDHYIKNPRSIISRHVNIDSKPMRYTRTPMIESTSKKDTKFTRIFKQHDYQYINHHNALRYRSMPKYLNHKNALRYKSAPK